MTKQAKQQEIAAALYARYSSDAQKQRSIDDQFFVCRKYAEREDYKVVGTYSDDAKTATTMFDRDGLRDLMAAAKRKEFDAVIVEDTDRLSRNQADLAWLFEHLQFRDVKLVTVAKGEVTEMQIAFDGISNPDYVKKLAARVKRGHDGIAREGKIAGGVCYGYDLVPGKPGERVINKEQAAVVVRIFTEYANGVTPRQIVAGLACDKIPSPTGSAVWNYQGIVGGLHKRGLIHNPLYVGEVVKNRYRNIKNPETGKRITRKASVDDLIVRSVPHLRIVDQTLWNAAHKVRQDRGLQKFGASGYVQRSVVPRKQHLLSGLLRCGECNGLMSVTASSRIGQRVGCSAATYRKTCTHTKTYDLGKLSGHTIDSMCSHLTDPEFIKERAKSKAVEFARLEKEHSGARQAAQKQFDRLNIQIARLVAAIEDSEQPVKELMASIKAKEIERVALAERIRLLGAESNVTTLHPHTITAFGKSIETLHVKLKRNADDPECRMAFGNIIDSIIVHPTDMGQPYEISLYARLSAIIGVDLFPARRSNKEIVAAEGLSRIGTGGTASSRPPSSRPFTGW
jgi:site-specific DNA recombinase